MTTPNDRDDVHRTNPDHAATDPRAAAQQDQVKRDHDLLEESARRVESSVSSDVRDTPVQPANRGADEARENADAARDSARRVESSVSSETRDTPVQPANRGADEARENADAARDSARRVDESVNRDRR